MSAAKNEPKFDILFRGGVMDGHEASRYSLPDFIEIPSDQAGTYRALRYVRSETVVGSQVVVYQLDRSAAP